MLRDGFQFGRLLSGGIVFSVRRMPFGGMSSPNLNERCPSAMSNGMKHLSTDCKEDSQDNSVSFVSISVNTCHTHNSVSIQICECFIYFLHTACDCNILMCFCVYIYHFKLCFIH